jgi:hypothetical protein
MQVQVAERIEMCMLDDTRQAVAEARRHLKNEKVRKCERKVGKFQEMNKPLGLLRGLRFFGMRGKSSGIATAH